MSKQVTIKLPSLVSEITITEEVVEKRDALITKAAELGKVTNDAEYAVASEYLREVTKMDVALEQKRKDFAKPFQDFTKVIKSAVDELRQPLEKLKADIKGWIIAYQVARDGKIKKEREAQEEKQRQEILKQESEHKKLMEVGLLDEEEEFIPDIEPVTEVIEAPPKPMGLKEWHKLVWDVHDEAEVPLAYKSVDSKKVNEWVRDNKKIILDAVFAGEGERIIPGLKFRAEKTVMTS